MSVVRWSSMVGFVALLACGAKERYVTLDPGERPESGSQTDDTPGPRGAGGDTDPQDPGAGGSGGGGGSAPPPAVDPNAPVVEIVAPNGARDPNDDEIVVETSLTVRCRATRSSSAQARDVDPASVKIELVDSADAAMSTSLPAEARAGDEYEAYFDLSSQPNGPLRFKCSASDMDAMPRTGSATLDTFLDLGPKLTILEPAADSSHALKDPVTIRFEVEPDPVSSGDAEADYQNLSLVILGQTFEPLEDPSQNGLYTLNVDFDDRTRFAMAPTTAEIVVRAQSSRTPVAPERVARADISLDATGPTISVMAPGYMTIVRGQVVLQVMISDPSGVDDSTVTGTINSSAYVLSDWEVMGTTYTEQFDTRDTVFDGLTQLTINVTATDRVGNTATTSHIVRLDNVPPLVSLDPPLIREYRKVAEEFQCSEAFDPVGEEAISDLDTATVSSLYRVLAFERTNVSPGQNYGYNAGLDPNSVMLYAQPDPAIPLLLDTNGDGTCDEINSAALPIAQRPVVLALQALSVRGASYFSSGADFDEPGHTAPFVCVTGGQTTPPTVLCPVTPMTRVIPQPIDGDPPAIFGIAPSNGSTGACGGNTWELLPIVGEGWACLAARAEDVIHNIGVSPPIRVCFDNGVGSPQCNTGSDTPPTCTDGCAPPPNLASNYMMSLD